MPTATTTPSIQYAAPRVAAPVRREPVARDGAHCDLCPTATARVRAVFEAGPIYLCGHHARAHWGDLTTQALVVAVDEDEAAFLPPDAARVA